MNAGHHSRRFFSLIGSLQTTTGEYSFVIRINNRLEDKQQRLLISDFTHLIFLIQSNKSAIHCDFLCNVLAKAVYEAYHIATLWPRHGWLSLAVRESKSSRGFLGTQRSLCPILWGDEKWCMFTVITPSRTHTNHLTLFERFLFVKYQNLCNHIMWLAKEQGSGYWIISCCSLPRGRLFLPHSSLLRCL